MKLENVFIALVPSFFVAIIIGGFLGGFINCTGCDGILDRVFLGLIFIIIGLIIFILGKKNTSR